MLRRSYHPTTGTFLGEGHSRWLFKRSGRSGVLIAGPTVWQEAVSEGGREHGEAGVLDEVEHILFPTSRILCRTF